MFPELASPHITLCFRLEGLRNTVHLTGCVNEAIPRPMFRLFLISCLTVVFPITSYAKFLNLKVSRNSKGRISEVQFPTGLNVEYVYDATDDIAEKIITRKSDAETKEPLKVLTPLSSDFNTYVLQDTYKRLENLPRLRGLIQSYLTEEKARLSKGAVNNVLNWAHQKRPEEKSARETLRIIKDLWWGMLYAQDLQPSAFEGRFRTVTGVRYDDVHPMQFKSVLDALLRDFRKKGLFRYNRLIESAWENRFVPLEPSHDLYPPTENVVQDISSCNPRVGESLQTILESDGFFFDSEQKQAGSAFNVVNPLTGNESRGIGITSLGAHFLSNRLIRARTDTGIYYMDEGFDEGVLFPTGSDAMAPFWLTHEYGHIVQHGLHFEGKPEIVPDHYFASMLLRYARNLHRDHLAKKLANLLVDPSTQITESSANFYAIDTLAGCL